MMIGGTEVRNISPLVCNCLYAAGMYYSWYIRETMQTEMEAQFAVILEALRGMGTAWRIASKFTFEKFTVETMS